MNSLGGLAKIRIAFIVLVLAMLVAQPAFSQEEGNDFNSIDLLSSTVYGMDTIVTQAEIDQLNLDNTDLQTEIDTNNTENTTTQGAIDANLATIATLDPVLDAVLIADLEAANLLLLAEIEANNTENITLQGSIDANNTTIAGLQGQLDYLNALSPDQVFALNRNLNNAIHSGLIINFDAALLQRIIDEDFDKHQINFLIISLEQEARFLAKYEMTGNERFLTKAETEKAKFLARIDSHNGNHDGLGDVAGEAASNAAGEAAREAAKAAADAAKEAGRAVAEEARAAAHEAASNAATHAANEAAGENAKNGVCHGNNPNC